jgi:ABC-type uncharacterized transport system ATPase subunit
VINRGQIIKQGRVRDIQQEFSQKLIHFELFSPEVDHLPGVRRVGTEFEYPFEDLPNDMRGLLNHYGENLKSFRNEIASLEKVFLKLTGEDAVA